MEYIRDYTMYTAVFGMFSLVWFGWAQENPKQNWRKYIGLASGIAFLLCLLGVYLSITHWHEASILSEKHAFTNYLIVFYTEFIIASIGAFWLMRRKKKHYIAPWIAFIVGSHFFWLTKIFNDPSLYILAILMIGIAFISPWLAKKLDTSNSAITGIGSGLLLLFFSILGLIRFLLA